jgi:hypothetical protein
LIELHNQYITLLRPIICSSSPTVGVGLTNGSADFPGIGGGSFGIDAKFWLIGVDEDFLAPAAI